MNKNKIWIKLTKSFRNGTLVDYKFVNKEDIDSEDKQLELMEHWGENSDGGHVYGYKVDMEILKDGELPPLEAIEKKIEAKKESIKWTEIKIEVQKIELQDLIQEREKLTNNSGQ